MPKVTKDETAATMGEGRSSGSRPSSAARASLSSLLEVPNTLAHASYATCTAAEPTARLSEVPFSLVDEVLTRAKALSSDERERLAREVLAFASEFL